MTIKLRSNISLMDLICSLTGFGAFDISASLSKYRVCLSCDFFDVFRPAQIRDWSSYQIRSTRQ